MSDEEMIPLEIFCSSYHVENSFSKPLNPMD